MTASSIGKVFGSQAQQNSLIYEKCKPYELFIQQTNAPAVVNTHSPMHWGNKYEPVTTAIYESIYKTKIEEFGCICHPQYSFLGASPDGIVSDPQSPKYGRMIEIKNIVNRDITKIPLEAYWIQMQIQMEVCDLDECDFVETRIKEYHNEDDFMNDTEHQYRGIIMYFLSKTQVGSTPHYVYMPLSIPLDQPMEIYNWMNEQKEQLQDEYSLYTVLYWYLDEISCILVPRNRLWFQAALPKIRACWETIVYERQHGYEHRAPKKRRVSIEENPTNVIIATNQGICLVKLDHPDNK
jgi:putative phage-type endonuclease